jgi:hypothetical protein
MEVAQALSQNLEGKLTVCNKVIAVSKICLCCSQQDHFVQEYIDKAFDGQFPW